MIAILIITESPEYIIIGKFKINLYFANILIYFKEGCLFLTKYYFFNSLSIYCIRDVIK